MTLSDMLEPGASDPALPVMSTAERIALSHAFSARRLADVSEGDELTVEDRFAMAAIGALAGRLLAGREEMPNDERNKAIRRMVRDAYIIADQALVERAK
jgi:hypothetical protein